MPKVKNPALAGQTLNVAGKVIALDAEGVADVTAEQAEILAQLEGYEIEAAKTEAPKAEPKKAEAKKAEPKKADATEKE